MSETMESLSDFLRGAFAFAGIFYAIFGTGPSWLSHLRPWQRAFLRMCACYPILMIWLFAQMNEVGE